MELHLRLFQLTLLVLILLCNHKHFECPDKNSSLIFQEISFCQYEDLTDENFNKLWLYTLLGCIGEQYNDSAMICGVVLNIRKHQNRINIWLDNTSSLVSDINIYIDDTTSAWKKGQVFKIKFNNTLTHGGHNVNLYSLKSSTLGWQLIATLSNSNFITNKPYVELICIDAIDKKFELDILR